MGCPVVITGGMLTCSMGAAPGTFTGGCTKVMVTSKPAGTVMDITMGKNIAPFGVCMSMANPAVAAATAAALGVLTPQPCTLQTDMATCSFGGVITVSNAGQVKVVGT